jgi:ankyrin repeat protein
MKRFRGMSRGITAVELVLAALVFIATVTATWPLLDERMNVYRDKALIRAAQEGNWSRMTALLRRGANPDGLSGETPHYCLFCEAVWSGKHETVDAILSSERGRGGTYLTHRPSPAICTAAQSPAPLKIVEVLIRHGADVNARDQKHFTALLHAAKRGDRALVELLLKNGADPNANIDWVTAEDLAHWEGHEKLAGFLAQRMKAAADDDESDAVLVVDSPD